jgi:Fe-coproporphyrin III synthase
MATLLRLAEQYAGRSGALNGLRARHDISLDGFAFCAACEYTPDCTDNCPGLAHSLTGEVNHSSPDVCLRRFLADGGKLQG